MNPERLRQALDSGAVVYGTWVQTPSPEVVEILGWSGWDFVILDLEHGPYGAETLPHLIRAAEAAETAQGPRPRGGGDSDARGDLGRRRCLCGQVDEVSAARVARRLAVDTTAALLGGALYDIDR